MVTRRQIDIARLPGAFHIGEPRSNLFDPGKPGQAVIRADDLLALRIELVNVAIVGTPKKLKRAGSGPARIVLHFPPQAIAEAAVYESPGDQINKDIDGDKKREEERLDAERRGQKLTSETETIPPRPLRARIARQSRVSFVIPDDPAWSIDYTLESVLSACRALSLDVVGTATKRSAQRSGLQGADWLKKSVGYLQSLEPAQRSRFSMNALRMERISAQDGSASATLQLRAALIGRLPAAVALESVRPIRGGKPQEPTPQQTAIELPWRLVISPHADARWQHASTPIGSQLTQRTELWHTRLITLKDGVPLDYPEHDPDRTVRAVWTRGGLNGEEPFNAGYPDSGDLPDPSSIPFLGALDDSDRSEFVHLSSNFSIPRYVPGVVDVNALMLSTLGGWLDARGAWDPPGQDFSVEEWVHRASMARDHYVRVVRKGFLFPFGHRVSLVKVTERKFHASEAGNAAILRQRTFIIVREPERLFTATDLKNAAGAWYHFKFPFSRVRILTTVTPDLANPRDEPSRVPGEPDLQMFYPHLSNNPNPVPFKFRCALTDLDGRVADFESPMIFIDNKLTGDAASWVRARVDWMSGAREKLRRSDLKLQRVALAASVKPGDTIFEVNTMEFGAETDNLAGFARNNGGIQCYPSVASVRARIPALSVLSGSTGYNTLKFEAGYLANGFADASNKGEIFLEVDPTGENASLDFSRQSDRSGGFVTPNLKPSGVSRLAGPVSGKLSDFAAGTPKVSDFFKELSPFLFGVIPLGEVVASIAAEAGAPSMPTFVAEAATKIECFIGDLVRLLDLLRRLPDEAGRIGQAGAMVIQKALDDLLNQALSQLDTAQAPIAQYKQRIAQARDELETFASWVAAQELNSANIAFNNTATLAAKIVPVVTKLNAVLTAVPSGVPSGFQQATTNATQRGVTVLNAMSSAIGVVNAAKQVVTTLEAVVGDPDATLAVFRGDANQLLLKLKLTAVRNAVDALRPLLAGDTLLDGSPRKIALSVIDALTEVFGVALASITTLRELFGGEELVVRFDWKPPLSNWALPGGDPKNKPLFRTNDKNGFIVAVEARAKRNGSGSPKISAVCSLKQFDLILINPTGFMELNFEKIEFRVDSAAKMNVDVLLTDIKFIGVLSFVETLRDLIPLDGFSDPPHLDITAQGIDAGFNVAPPNTAVGMFSLTNLSLSAGFTVPFIGQPLAVRFNFCTREQPFNLTVALFGGGGFFGITVDPGGVQLLEAAFEFGANVSIDFGVASGGVHVMAGIYFRMERDEAQLAGYFRLGGYVSVLGLVSASLELYLELRYEFATGKAAGRAQLTIEISVLMFSTSVTITCERKFAGSNGDPSFAELMGPEPAQVLTNTLVYPWREYCEAFE